jgi:hypothetical protein
MKIRIVMCGTLCLALGMAGVPATAKIIVFDVPNSINTAAGSININDVIAGGYDDASGSHGLVRTPDGTITTFDPPGSVETLVGTINDGGTIVGT